MMSKLRRGRKKLRRRRKKLNVMPLLEQSL